MAAEYFERFPKERYQTEVYSPPTDAAVILILAIE
jgi:hypothetical protein